MKKFLAALLAVLMLFSASSVTVFAEDTTEAETTTEPEVTYKEYEICEDADFSNVVYMEAGNEKATLLLPGDKIFTYKTTTLTINYYPDADARSKGEWVSQDTNNLAFSPSAKEYFREQIKKPSGQPKPIATIQNVDFTDFTIAYSGDNKFLGWAIYEYIPQSNTINLCGVWDKQHKVPVEDDTDDYQYIVDTTIKIWKAIFKPFTAVISFITNGCLFVYNWFYNLFFGAKAA